MDASAQPAGLFARLFRKRPDPVPDIGGLAPVAIQEASSVRGDSAITWFRLATCQGKVVSLNDAHVLGFADRLDAAHAILMAVPAAVPQIGVLVAPDARAFHIKEDTQSGIASSALIVQTDTQGVVRLKYPLAGPAFLIAMHDAPEGVGIRFDGAGDTIDVAFGMIAVVAADVPAAARALGAEIGLAASDHLRAAPLLGHLASVAIRPGLAQALLRVMPRDELSELARLLLERPRDLAVLGRAIPESLWLVQHLPALTEWRKTREPKLTEGLRYSPAADANALHPVKGAGQMPVGLALYSLARRHILPRRGACILATAKNEGVYLLDWIAYHLSIGFEHIFLYSNDNQDGSDALLAALDRAGTITWIRNERGERLGAQEKAYAHALTMLPQILDYRWTAVIDLDEYIGFDATIFRGIGDFIGFQEAQSVDAIALCWQFFAARPGEVWRDEFTPARLTQREATADRHVKTIFRPRLFCWSRPHDPVPTLGAPFEYRTQDGSLHHHGGVQHRIPAFAEKPLAIQAWVNHYLVRTPDELLWKWQRGRANWLDKSQHGWFLEFLCLNFFQLARPERLVADTRLLECARGRAAMRERLLAMPDVADSHLQITRVFTAEIARIRREFLATPPAEEHELVQQLRKVLSETHPQ